MKIGFLTPSPAQITSPVFRRLSAAGADVEVIFSRSLTVPSDSESGIRPEWSMDLFKGFSYRAIEHWPRQLLRTLVTFDHRIMFIPGWSGKGNVLMLLLGSVRRRIGVVSDTATFDQRTGFKQRVRKLYVPMLLKGARVAIATSQLAAAELRQLGMKADRIFVIPYMVETEFIDERMRDALPRRPEIRRRLGIGENEILILSVIKFVEREGVADLLSAFEQVDDSRARLVIVGDGPLRSIVEASSGNVLCVGYKPYAEVFDYYAAADVFVHPPLHENWGIPVVEAMLAGLPVVASDGVGAAHELIDKKGGLMFKRADPIALRSALEKMLDLPAEERSILGRVNRDIAHRFNEEGWKPEFQRLLDFLGRS